MTKSFISVNTMIVATPKYRKGLGHMLSIHKKSIFKLIKQYLMIYKPLFYKRGFNNFILLICAFLAIQEVRSIKFIYEKFIKKYFDASLNRFYYFLADEGLDLSKLMCCTIKKALSLIPSSMSQKITIYLIVDDTLQPKFGQHFESCSTLFDHANHDGQSYINGHCFVSLAMSIPIITGSNVKYITVPIGCKLYDKTQTKLELAAEMIEAVAGELIGYQVIVLCDAWYTKKSFIARLMALSNVELMGAVRVDTAVYDLPPKPTGKRGRPRKKGDRIDYKELNYTDEGDLKVSTIYCLTNLIAQPIYATYTTTNTETFSSVRLYISTIPLERINSFTVKTDNGMDLENKPKVNNVFQVFRMRWPIEVMFYQEKTFWSFGKYMVRSKVAIEKYAYLVGVTYTLVTLLPFIEDDFSEYQFKSPQEIKYGLGADLHRELILSNLLETLQKSEKPITLEELVKDNEFKDLVQ